MNLHIGRVPNDDIKTIVQCGAKHLAGVEEVRHAVVIVGVPGDAAIHILIAKGVVLELVNNLLGEFPVLFLQRQLGFACLS